MIGAAFSSLGVSTALMFLCAVNCPWNSVSAVGGSHVPAPWPTWTHLPGEKNGAITALWPGPNRVALLSVGAPYMTSTLGFLTFHAETQLTRPSPIRWPTCTLLKLTDRKRVV